MLHEIHLDWGFFYSCILHGMKHFSGQINLFYRQVKLLRLRALHNWNAIGCKVANKCTPPSWNTCMILLIMFHNISSMNDILYICLCQYIFCMMEEESGIVYIMCEGETDNDCFNTHIGETGWQQVHWTLESQSTSILASKHKHFHTHPYTSRVGHHIAIESLDRVTIINQQPSLFERWMEETVYIFMYHPNPKHDGSHHRMPLFWDSILQAYHMPF